jgi:hypothetical protein
MAIHGNQSFIDLEEMPFRSYLAQHELLLDHLEKRARKEQK